MNNMKVQEQSPQYGQPVPYEERVRSDFEYALEEGSMFFNAKSQVHKALRKITAKMAELNLDYAVVGGMALAAHGYDRFTDDVDLLVTGETLKIIHASLEGLGYLPPFAGSKQLRDTECGVRIEFLITGGFPGDGKPKPVAFPDPKSETTEMHGMRILRLERIIELKLASGMTNAGRLKDLADVQELCKRLKFPDEFADQLNPFVRERFLELLRSSR
jgi:hypothetical protein